MKETVSISKNEVWPDVTIFYDIRPYLAWPLWQKMKWKELHLLQFYIVSNKKDLLYGSDAKTKLHRVYVKCLTQSMYSIVSTEYLRNENYCRQPT